MALEKNIVLDASRHEVWDKVATGPGLSSWFVPHELEPREGGTGRADFGGTTLAEGVIEVYDQDNRVVYRGKAQAEAGETEPKLEFRLADDGGNRTTLTLRQEGFPETDQAVYEAGWDVYLHTLKASFEHFGGERAATTASFVDSPLGEKTAFEKVQQHAIGAGDDVSEGQQVQLNAPEATEGVVDLRKSEAPLDAITIRTDDGFVRIIAASYTASGDDEGCAVSVTRFKYASGERLAEAVGREEVDAAALQLWLQEALG